MSGRDGNRSNDSLNKAADLLFYPMAGVATFLLGPQAYRLTKGYISDYAASEFGDGGVRLFELLWVVGCGIATFGFALIVLILIFRVGLVKLFKLIAGG